MALADKLKSFLFSENLTSEQLEKARLEKATLTKPSPMFAINDSNTQNANSINPYYGNVGPNYYASTGMPWLSSDARKAVLTDWFWQPIRGQPRRVDTNELRKYANTIWVQSIVQTVLNQVASVPWDLVPVEGVAYPLVAPEIYRVKNWLENPNDNSESFSDLLRAWIKDVLEIDAGVMVKVFSIDSYDFEHLEARSGAPLLKPLVCPECNGTGMLVPGLIQDKVKRTRDSMNKAIKELPLEYEFGEKKYKVIKQDYEKVFEILDVIEQAKPADPTEMLTCPFCNGTGQGRHLKELYVRDGASFLADCDRTGWIYGYWQYSYSIPAHPMWFNKEEIVYFKQCPRSQNVYGWSAVQSSIEVIKSLEYSVRHNMALFIDGAVPDGVVSVLDMSDEELMRMQIKWQNELKGQPHKTVFVNKQTEFTPFSFNNRDMQFLEGQTAGWKQVISNFNLSPADMGITEDVNRATAGNQTEISRRKAVRPLLKKLEYLINTQVVPELTNSGNIKFQFVVDDPVEERMQAELNEIYLRSNVMSVNEVRDEMGRQPVAWGEGESNKDESVLDMFSSPFKSSGEADTESDITSEPADASQKGVLFNAQPSSNVQVQNLSQPMPMVATAPKGHVNNQAPYSEIGARCPGCGQPTLLQETEGLSGVSYRCINPSCNRTFTQSELEQGIDAQRDMHGHASKGLSKKLDIQDLDEWLNLASADILDYIKIFIDKYNFKLVNNYKVKLKELKSIFREAFESRLSIPAIRNKLIDIGYERKEADAIARTELTRIANESLLVQAKDLGKDEVQFVATRDDLVCPLCEKLDGVRMSLSTARGMIPVHPNCRCTWRVVVNTSKGLKKEVKLVPQGEEERPDDNYNAVQLRMGVKTEMEHTDDIVVATKIAKDHLDEDEKYYTKLKRMEREE